MKTPSSLARAPERFSLFAALRLIEAMSPEQARIGRGLRPRDEVVRLAQLPSLRFAPGEVTHIDEQHQPPRLYAEGFGLLGPNGPLPLHLTEYADERRRLHQDPGFADFLNLFHHRLASLFYRAWADASPAVEADRPDNRYVLYLGALMGLGAPALLGQDAVGDRAKLHRAGRYGAQTRSMEGLEDILEDHFDLAVRIEPFQPQWLDIPAAERLRLGRASRIGRLGRDANLGGRSWQCQFGFRIVLQRLSRPDFDRFLPGRPALRALADLVRAYIGEELRWDLELQLEPGQAPPLRLSRGLRLGMSTWLGRRGRDKAKAHLRDAHTRRAEARHRQSAPRQGE